eukprot:jgi/Botrbrau1/17294/Bobra.0015s0051.1
MVSRLGIYHTYTSANHPSANGVAERMVQTIKKMLTTYFTEHPLNWISALHTMRLAYMCSPHKALNDISPCEMLFGFRPKLPLAVSDVLCNSFNVVPPLNHYEHVHMLQDELKLYQDDAALALDQAMYRNVMSKLKKKKVNKDIKVGDLVPEITLTASPLRTNLKGPFWLSN